MRGYFKSVSAPAIVYGLLILLIIMSDKELGQRTKLNQDDRDAVVFFTVLGGAAGAISHFVDERGHR